MSLIASSLMGSCLFGLPLAFACEWADCTSKPKSGEEASPLKGDIAQSVQENGSVVKVLLIEPGEAQANVVVYQDATPAKSGTKKNIGQGEAASGPFKVTIASAIQHKMTVNMQPVIYPYVTLKITGSELSEVKAKRLIIDEATDGAENSLPKEKLVPGKFQPVNLFQRPGRPATQLQEASMLEFQGTPTKTIKLLTGKIELMMPAKDPESIIKASFAKEAGTPLQNEALKAAGVEITLKEIRGVPKEAPAPKSWEIVYDIKDPKNKIIGSPEFSDAAGKEIKPTGGYGAGVGTKTMAATFKTKPPEDIVVKFYLMTDKAVVTVPFEFKDIPLK